MMQSADCMDQLTSQVPETLHLETAINTTKYVNTGLNTGHIITLFTILNYI